MIKTMVAFALLAFPAAAAKNGSLDTARIEQLTGVKGKWNEKEGVFKVEMPRTDLAVTAAGSKLTTPLGLTAWAAFTKAGPHAVVMGDMVLTEDQVNPAMSAALDNGLEVTALHNHFFWEMKQKFDVPSVSIDPANTTLDPKKIDAVLGRSGDLNKGVYKITIGRQVKMAGHAMGTTMGVNTWAAFAGSDDQAIVDGDFAMLEGEMQNVLKALRHAGINVVAIHQHMTGETPRMLFLHYWGVGRTEDLARGLKNALGQTHS
jgi:hypothetical protein